MTQFQPHPMIEKDSVFVRDLPLSQLRIQNQSAVPWLVLVPRREETEIYKLPVEAQTKLINEITMASKAVMALFTPDKINVGALGNLCPQLHIHVIGRFHKDAAWPQPVWGRLEPSPYSADKLNDVKLRLSDEALWH